MGTLYWWFTLEDHQQYAESKVSQRSHLAVVTEEYEQEKKIADSVLEIPQTLNALVPLLSVLPLQILAYYVAVDKGLDVDMPSNLAKSVTVE